jgi:hypothetical protein
MCGIAGFDRLTPATRAIIPFLMWEMEDRGRQSWGCSNGLNIFKTIGAVTSTWRWPDFFQDGQPGIFHTRQASTGAVTEANAHPFSFINTADFPQPTDPEAAREYLDDPAHYLIGVHNGVIHNHDTINRERGRDFAVDSMHIFANIAEGAPTDELCGWGAIAWLTHGAKGTLHFSLFNMNSLHIAKLESGEIVFCSTKEPISRAACMAGAKVKTFFEVKEGIHYVIGPNPDVPGDTWLLIRGDMKFGARPAFSASTAAAARTTLGLDAEDTWYDHWHRTGGRGGYTPMGYSSTGSNRSTGSTGSTSSASAFDRRWFSEIGRSNRDNGVCCEPGCGRKVDRKRALLCDWCLRKIQKDIGLYVPTAIN